VLQNEEALRLLAQKHETTLNADIRATVANRQFWADCEHIVTCLRPLMSIIGKLESQSATLADCYQQLVSLAAAIDSVGFGPAEFKSHCCAAFCRRWDEFNDDVYVLAYFLHPGMRGKGVSSGLFPKIAETAATMWKNFGNSKVSTLKLMSQLMKYKSGDAPYNLQFASDFMSPTLWWQTTEDSVGAQLKTLAVTLLSITPHSAACERTFSILGWIHSKSRNRMLISRLEAIRKLYLYYVSHQSSDGRRTSSTANDSDQNTSINYYGEDDVEDSLLSSTDFEISRVTPGPDDNENFNQVWTTVKRSFDLPAFQHRQTQRRLRILKTLISTCMK
jgi:GNAT superfamily N-acetyltransferase